MNKSDTFQTQCCCFPLTLSCWDLSWYGNNFSRDRFLSQNKTESFNTQPQQMRQRDRKERILSTKNIYLNETLLLHFAAHVRHLLVRCEREWPRLQMENEIPHEPAEKQQPSTRWHSQRNKLVCNTQKRNVHQTFKPNIVFVHSKNCWKVTSFNFTNVQLLIKYPKYLNYYCNGLSGCVYCQAVLLKLKQDLTLINWWII